MAIAAERVEVMKQISGLLDGECAECEKKTERKRGDQFLRNCIERCPVGAQLKEFGKQLERKIPR